jgi:trinucleotide repeat-containing gene 6 protein
MKIEDDPTITPGSVARSPLSIAAKESDLFATSSKTSPTESLNLSSSTWSFNNSQQGFSNTIAKPSAELWNNPIGNSSQVRIIFIVIQRLGVLTF